ncbi:GFA family protein [Streptomyces flavidovirens]|uniref:GFA family protein n=1 Tax=Streptomyces flavidovirens TaxID=67298 RepID=UPI00055A11CA|nr:aldehyde-activating protein [Streptomyces flavidovirens]
MSDPEGESSTPELTWIDGQCHCARVRFRVALAPTTTITQCNCGICYMSGHEEIMVPEERFRLLEGRQCLKEYRFGVAIADHTFCSVCGIMPFYRPRSHPTGFFSVNARCLLGGKAVVHRVGDRLDLGFGETIEYVEFDGQNWEASIAAGQHVVTD